MGITATTRSGNERRPISRGALHQLLRNPIYAGLIPHKGECFPGQHEPIIDRATWDAVQVKLKAGTSTRNGSGRKTQVSPLLGKLFDEEGRGLTPSHANKQGRRYRYYQTRAYDLDEDRRSDKGSRGWRLPAKELEQRVVALVESMLADRAQVGTTAMEAGCAIGEVEALLAKLARADVSEKLDWVERIQLGAHGIHLRLTLPASRPIKLTREVPASLKRRGVEQRLVIDATVEKKAPGDPRMLRALQLGFAYWEQLSTDGSINLREFAKRESVEERFIGRALPLVRLRRRT